MNNKPQSSRIHIGIFGETNSGKSTLFNALTNTNISIVSEIRGTTTDPVKKSMELIPFGPIVLIDTAGLGDTSELGEKRIEKTIEIISKIDFALYLADINCFNEEEYKKIVKEFAIRKVSHILVFTKVELSEKKLKSEIKNKFEKSILLDCKNLDEIEKFKICLIKELTQNTEVEKSLLKDLIAPFSNVVLVAPQDSEAPKGRLILPQAQLIRDCLDNNILCSVTTLETLEGTLESLKKIDLVVTDSQVFKDVEKIIPKNIKLTSFSILFANQKGEVNKLFEGISTIENLKNNDKILISEVCTHNVSHEDIGRVKIPKLLQQKTGLNLTFDYQTGKDFDIKKSEYAMIIHCGGCMITKKDMINRINVSIENDIPITNYGMLIAYCTGILERSMEILT